MLIAFALLLRDRLKSELPNVVKDRGILYLFGDFWTDHGHEAVKEFPLLAGSPFKLMAILFCYLYAVAALSSKRRRPLSNENVLVNGRRIFSNRAPAILLLNGLQLGLNGAWFLLGLFLSPLGQHFVNPEPDERTRKFLALLKIYFCSCFLIFKVFHVILHVLLLALTRRRRLVKLELLENVTIPLIVYLSAKFGQFEYLLLISLINSAVSFVQSSYLTLAAAKVVTSFPDKFWECSILALKAFEYSALYFFGYFFFIVRFDNSTASLSSMLQNAVVMAYSSIMNFTVWCSFVVNSEES